MDILGVIHSYVVSAKINLQNKNIETSMQDLAIVEDESLQDILTILPMLDKIEENKRKK
ncbi:MAG: hypothetical protein RCG15_06055 [Candidatus Rickettsia vulgarisii]